MQNEAPLAGDGDGDGRVVAYPEGIELATQLAAEVNNSSTLMSEYAGRKPSPSFLDQFWSLASVVRMEYSYAVSQWDPRLVRIRDNFET